MGRLAALIAMPAATIVIGVAAGYGVLSIETKIATSGSALKLKKKTRADSNSCREQTEFNHEHGKPGARGQRNFT